MVVERGPEIICVLGMHRAGTSLVAWVLNLLGVYLGPEDHLMPPAPSNPKGFWENIRLTALNEEILSRFRGSWHEPPDFPPRWEDDFRVADLKEWARELLEEEFASRSLWGWKDPRNSLTLPFWKALLSNLKFVVCLRNPLEVARSLADRDGFPLEKGLRLWTIYVSSALLHTQGLPCLFLFFEDFLHDWQRELGRLAAFIGRPKRATHPDIQAAVQEFLEPELRRHSSSPEEMLQGARLSFPAVSLYLALRAMLDLEGSDPHKKRTYEAVNDGLLKGLPRISLEAQRTLSQMQRDLKELSTKVQGLKREVEGLQQERDGLQRTLWEVYHSRTWQVGLLLKRLRSALYIPDALIRPLFNVAKLVLTAGGSFSQKRINRYQRIEHVEELPSRPEFAFILPFCDARWQELKGTITSLQSQTYPHWRLFLLSDGDRPLWDAIGVTSDPRIRVFTSGCRLWAKDVTRAISSSPVAFVGFLSAGDTLSPTALLEVAKGLGEALPEIIYTDELVLIEGGREVPFFKPDWSPDLFLSFNYLGGLSLVRRDVFLEVGGLNDNFHEFCDYDLLLRATERAHHILHIPLLLYRRAERRVTPQGNKEGRKALQDALNRRGLKATVELTAIAGRYRVRYDIGGDPRVSIIIPTRDKTELLRRCIRSIEEKTSYQNYEVIVVDNGSTEPESLQYLKEIQKEHVVRKYPGPFNFSRINNFAAREARGEYLLFLNNDVEVIAPDWITALLEHAQRPEVGAVGAKLLYPDGRIQHAGVILGVGGIAGHAFRFFPSEVSYFGLADVVRNYSAVTGACMMVRKEIFTEIGGFDESFWVGLNDVDFCLKLRARGYLIVYTPYAVLYHVEKATRGTKRPVADERRFRRRWRAVLKEGDPYYNPHLRGEAFLHGGMWAQLWWWPSLEPFLTYDLSKEGIGYVKTVDHRS